MKRRRKGSKAKQEEAAVVAEDGEDDEEDDEEAADGEIDVEFEFFDPTEEDFHGVKDLLRSGTWSFIEDPDGSIYSELADEVVNQGNIGTLVKSSNSAEPSDASICGLLSVLNMRQFATKPWSKAFKEALLQKAQKHGADASFTLLKGLLDPPKKSKEQLGLVFNERFTNLPLDVIPALHKALLEDIEWSCTTPECPPEERPFYFFTHLLFVSRCYFEVSSSDSGKKKRKADSSSSGRLTFLRPEDGVYAKRAGKSLFTFPVAKDEETGKTKGRGLGPPERRAVFLLTRRAFEDASKQLEAELQQAFEDEA